MLNHSLDKYGLHLNCQIMVYLSEEKARNAYIYAVLSNNVCEIIFLDRPTSILSKAVGN